MKRALKITFSLIILLIVVLGFALPLNPVGNWYQQFMPNIGSRSIQDIFFLDSLTGWAVTNATNQGTDTTFVLKTTNSGDNWLIHFRKIQTGGGFSGYFKIYFLNQNVGYATDVRGIYKTTDGGMNWVSLNAPQNAYLDMSVLNTNTIWLASTNLLTGGVFFTSNGGANWQQQFSGGNQNPNRIYMYNARIGFMSNNSGSPNIYSTTNGGVNWSINVGGEKFSHMYFNDSLTGWRTKGDTLKFTSNGGNTWSRQIMPYGGMIFSSEIGNFYNINRDTIWGIGGYVLYPNNSVKSILYRTTNGGVNWQYQIPDTSFSISYYHIKFTDKFHGWIYDTGPFGTGAGIHTTVGGDAIWITGVTQISNEVPGEFKLLQNYPNPFNPATNIKYQIVNSKYVRLIVYDIQGREIAELVNQKQSAGTYEVDFDGSSYSSGVYFYKLTATTAKEVFTETKKMLMIK